MTTQTTSAGRKLSTLPSASGGLPLLGNLLQLSPERLHII